MRHPHRGLLLLAVLAATNAWAQTPASRVVAKRDRIDIAGLPGKENLIAITESDGVVTIRDGAGSVVLVRSWTPGCVQSGDVVTCPRPTRIRIRLGDRDDLLLNLTSIPLLARGGKGNDSMFGGAGDDVLIGDAGDDVIVGGDGDDELRGSIGADVLEGNGGADLMRGQGGFDTVRYRNPLHWPVVTFDGRADDGEPGERDNVTGAVEAIDVHPFNYRADLSALSRGGTMSLWDTWVADGTFDLATRPEAGVQVVGYYDTDGYVRVAARRLGETSWVHTPRLPTIFVKQRDGHRAIRLAFDPDGRLHLASNHHGTGDHDPGEPVLVCCSPLQYFRTPQPVNDPEDVMTLTRIGMRSPDFENPIPSEDVVTYPNFFTGEDGRFYFTYRDGYSHGAEFYVNELDRRTGTWRNPNGGVPWFSGVQGFVNPDEAGAYGTFSWDGDRFHLIFRASWRKKQRCGVDPVDHRCLLFHVWTRDFDRFYDVAGTEVATPLSPAALPPSMVLDRAELGGLSWMNSAIRRNHRPIVGYMKFVTTRVRDGVTEGSWQAFVATWDGAAWRQRQLSSFDLWFPTQTEDGIAVDLPSIVSIVGPIDDGDRERWFVRATVFASPAQATGWFELDPDRLDLAPTPDFTPPPAGECDSRTGFLPLQHPDWVDPGNGQRFVQVIQRSNEGIDGLHGEAGDFYYLSWDQVGAPTVDPPLVRLSLRRTQCVKQ